ncbi:putative holin-like toxin [Anaerostipes caccae]
MLITTYEALSLMITFGMFILALLAYIDRKNKQK